MTDGRSPREGYAGVRALLLGASGFIGGNVARALDGAGAVVTAVVRTEEGAKRLAVAAGAGPDVLRAELDEERVGELIDRVSADVVFNLAGYGVDPSERDEAAAEAVNVGLVRGICRALLRSGGTAAGGLRLVHVGSALEYGEIAGDLREESVPDPTTLYGRTKLEGTRVVEAAVADGLAAVTARLFTVYGPGEHPERLLPTLRASAAGADAIALTAGLQERDFTHVDDVAEGLLRLGLLETIPYPTLNLATGVLTSVRRVVETYADLLGIGPERLDFGALPTRREEMAHDPVNVERLEATLGWRPSTGVEDGLRATHRALNARGR